VTTTFTGTYTVHGLANTHFDDYRIPPHIWSRLQIEGDHWIWHGSKDSNPQIDMAVRLLGWRRDEVLAAVPTCGVARCAKPMHICATKRNPNG
jgi:hypothetical protein